MDRVTADQMGMLATVINSLAMQDALERQAPASRVMSALQIHEVCEDYIRRRAVRHLEKGRVSIFAAGTGNPFFTTDTAASLRAIEISADVAHQGDQGRRRVFGGPGQGSEGRSLSDAVVRPGARPTDLRVMDATAIVMCRENNLPLMVFNLNNPGDLVRVVMGETVGTSGQRIICPHRNRRMIDDIKKDGRTAHAQGVEALKDELQQAAHGARARRPARARHGRVLRHGVPSSRPPTSPSRMHGRSSCTPWEKNMVSAVEKAIINSGLGLNPVTAGR